MAELASITPWSGSTF